MAAISPLSEESSSRSDSQIEAAKQSDGLESTNDARISVNGGEVKKDEDVFTDAPEAPIDDQNCVLVDKDAEFVDGGEGAADLVVNLAETAADLDVEFQPADGISGDGESVDAENCAGMRDSAKDEILGDVEGGKIDGSADLCREENHVEVDVHEKIIEGGDAVSSSVTDLVDAGAGEEAVNHDVGDDKDETSGVEIGAAATSGVTADYEKTEKFEEALASFNEGAAEANKVEDEPVNGDMESDISNDQETNLEGILQGDAIDNATTGAGNDESNNEVFEEYAIDEASAGVDNDENSDEVKRDVSSDGALEEINLLSEKDNASSFDKAVVDDDVSVVDDENIVEEKKEISSVGEPKEESLSSQEQVSENKLDVSENRVDKNEEHEDSSAQDSEKEKAEAGISDKAAVGIESPVKFTISENANAEADRAIDESEANNSVDAPELATHAVNVVHDRQLAPTHADDSESMQAECSDLVGSDIQASTSATETDDVKKASEIPYNNVGEDHNTTVDKTGEEQQSSESNLTGSISMLDTLEATDEYGSHMESLKDIDGQIASDYDEEGESDEENNNNREMIDPDALIALLKAASSSTHDGPLNIPTQDGNKVFLVDRPAGLGPSIPSLKPAPPRATRSNLSASEMVIPAASDSDMTEEEKVLHDKIELIKVKFLRLVQRLGHSPDDTVAAQVLYRLGLAEGIRHGRQSNRAFSLENAKKKALQLEADGNEALDFSCNILVLGKSGVGKSATINSIFGKEKSNTNAFEPATEAIKEITGIVDGVKVRVIDTPGLRMSMMDQTSNRKILLAIKKYTKKCPPDIVLYVDRMDIQTRDFNDLPLLKSITSTLGSSIWFNAIVALTHAASAPPDGPSGAPLSYEVYVAQRSHIIQQSIRLAAGDMRLMNPVALVENHESCRKNRYGQKVLPNGLAWRPQMLLLCYSSKILSEANSLLKLQDPAPKKLFNFRFRSPPLPFLLSSLLQSKPHPKLTPEQGGEAVDSDIDLDDFSDSDQEDEVDEYDQLPPFKPLSKAQIRKLTKEQRQAYFDEFDYRVKLLQKRQWKNELKRMKEMKKGAEKVQDDFGYGQMAEDSEQDNAPATVPVPLPDMVLPPSFDCEAPTYRYRFLEPTSQLLARPVLDTHGWDHDCGYDGVSLEESLAIASRFPAVISAQVTKDKKDFSIHLESSVSAKHGDSGSSLAGFNVQAVGKQLAYTVSGETKFKNFKKNKTAGGFSVTFLGETVATGLKFGDELSIGKRVSLISSAGAVRSQGDTAYGANLEARLRDKEYPIGQTLMTLGLSLMKWHSDLALGANLQSQFSVGRNSKMAVRLGLNNKLTGQITVKTSSSEQLQLALVGIIPVALSIYRNMMGSMD